MSYVNPIIFKRETAERLHDMDDEPNKGTFLMTWLEHLVIGLIHAVGVTFMALLSTLLFIASGDTLWAWQGYVFAIMCGFCVLRTHRILNGYLSNYWS